jgi:hypothetical protein
LTGYCKRQFDAREDNYTSIGRKRIAICVSVRRRRVANVWKEGDVMVVGYGNGVQLLIPAGDYEFSCIRTPLVLCGWTFANPIIVAGRMYLKIA